jgi:hypothetical protein
MKPQRGVILIAAAVTLASCSSGSSNPATTRPIHFGCHCGGRTRNLNDGHRVGIQDHIAV